MNTPDVPEDLVFCTCGLAMYLLPSGVLVCPRCDMIDEDGPVVLDLEDGDTVGE